MRKIIGAAIAVFAVALLILVTQLGTGGVKANAVTTATIDFQNNLSPGDIVSSVDCTTGMNCTADPGGAVGVSSVPANMAMIFDATCPPDTEPADCSGDDPDLFQPTLGNVLIVSEDGDGSDPDDAVGGTLKFDFSTWGPDAPSATVCVESVDVLDQEEGGTIEVFSDGGGTSLQSQALAITGDGGLATEIVGVCGVDFMVVTFIGSGAVDNIAIELEENGGGEGCTPGFWKNNLDAWPPTLLSPGDSFESIFLRDAFDDPDDPSLLEVMNFHGGGLNRLSAHAVAALLNASHPNVDYDLTPAEVIAAWQAAFDDGTRSAINDQKDIFVGFNELGCDVNN